MGLFRKKSKTHFVRDKAGHVVKVERYGDSKTPVSDKLLSQARAEKRQARAEVRERSREKKRMYREEYEKARHKAKLSRMKREGSRAGSSSPIERVGRMSNYSTRRNYNPWGSMFDTGLGYSKPSKKKKSKKKKSGLGSFDMTDNWGFMK